ncbi:MAG: hypothetical protein J7L25_11495 [Deltaproteobacteria bacterium]|nr:hypothetical protein [Candidatus Tharpella aukensis]
MPKIKKYYYSLLLFSVLTFCFSSICTAQPPEVSNPLEKRLYHGSVEEISGFIDQRQKQFKEIITKIDEVEVEPKTTALVQSSSTAVKDLYRGLLLQCDSLLAELQRASTTSFDVHSNKEPPYNLVEFDKAITSQQQINTQLSEHSRRFALLQSRIISLKESAVAQLSEYAKLLKTDAENSLLLYEKYGELLSLQNEYALLKIKEPKLEKILVKFNDNKNSVAEQVKEIFNQLKITPENIKQAQKAKNEQYSLFKKTGAALSSEYQDLNRRILLYEAQLDKTLDILKSSRENDLVRKGWEIEKNRIELILDALKLRIHLGAALLGRR